MTADSHGDGDGDGTERPDPLTPTHNLEAAVGVNLSHVPRAEPPLTALVHEEVLIVALTPVVTHGDVGPTDQHLPPGVWFVLFGVATC